MKWTPEKAQEAFDLARVVGSTQASKQLSARWGESISARALRDCFRHRGWRVGRTRFDGPVVQGVVYGQPAATPPIAESRCSTPGNPGASPGGPTSEPGKVTLGYEFPFPVPARDDFEITVDPLEAAYAERAAKDEKHAVKKQRDALLDENQRLRRELDTATALRSRSPEILVYRQAAHERADAVAVAVASDWHVEEPVEAKDVHGLNEYNLEVAKARAERFFENALTLALMRARDSNIKTLYMPALGDFFSGFIHEELAANNLLAPITAAEFVKDLLASGIEFWLKESPFRIEVDGIAGNHGRMTKQMHFSDPTGTSIETFMYAALADRYHDNPRVDVRVARQAMIYRDFFERFKLRLIHGYEVKYGGGVGGITIPLNKAIAAWDIGIKADQTVCGHFHQLFFAPRFIVNGCFPAGSKVVVPEGVRAIESLRPGDLVQSRDGSTQKVLNTTTRRSDTGLVHLKIAGIEKPLVSTPNHEVWSLKTESRKADRVGAKWDAYIGNGDRPQWIPADFLSPGDYVHVPRPPEGLDTHIDEEQAWMYGLYLAEGSTLLDGGSSKKHNRICLTMHERELGVLERWARVFERTYGILPRVHHRKKRRFDGSIGTTSELIVSPGRGLCALFRDLFGHLASGKKLPAWFFDLSSNLKRQVIQGWIDGDGHTNKRGQTTASTISETLAYQMFKMALACNLVPSMSAQEAGGPRKNKSYTLHFQAGQETKVVDGELFLRVRARYRDRAVVDVYDLEVSGEHTYTVNFVGVHNSMIGYNTFAQAIKASYEDPQQAFFLIHARGGGERAGCDPIWLTDKRKP